MKTFHNDIPKWLTYLKDTISEGLPDEEAKDFPLQFMESMPVGVTQEQLYKLHCDLDYQRLSILLENLQEKDNEWGVRAAIEECMRLNKEYVDREDRQWSGAYLAADSAAGLASGSAHSAAMAAAYSADPTRSALSARLVAYSVEEAADAAAEANTTYSAAYAAEAAVYRGERDRLLEGLKNL